MKLPTILIRLDLQIKHITFLNNKRGGTFPRTTSSHKTDQ